MQSTYEFTSPRDFKEGASIGPSLALTTGRIRRGELWLEEAHRKRLVKALESYGLGETVAISEVDVVFAQMTWPFSGLYRFRLELKKRPEKYIWSCQMTPFWDEQNALELWIKKDPDWRIGLSSWVKCSACSGEKDYLLINEEEQVFEASRYSLFGITNEAILIPQSSQALFSLSLEEWAHSCKEEGINVSRQKILLGELVEMDALFAVNALRGIRAVAKIDNFSLARKVSPRLKDLIDSFNLKLR